jgi:hypothetical protein
VTNVGVNLKPEVTEFSIQPNAFFIKVNSSLSNPPGTIAIKNGSVEDGCASEGLHTLLRFNFILKNIGDQNLVIGRPSSRLDIFEPAKHNPTQWITTKRFNEYYLKGIDGTPISLGHKRYHCIKDTTGNFNCDNQGISAGNQDTYSINELCNFLVIDNLENGCYQFEAVTNVSRVFKEDSYDDNSISLKLIIKLQERFVEVVQTCENKEDM